MYFVSTRLSWLPNRIGEHAVLSLSKWNSSYIYYSPEHLTVVVLCFVLVLWIPNSHLAVRSSSISICHWQFVQILSLNGLKYSHDIQLPHEEAVVEIVYVATDFFGFQHTDNNNYNTSWSSIVLATVQTARTVPGQGSNSNWTGTMGFNLRKTETVFFELLCPWNPSPSKSGIWLQLSFYVLIVSQHDLYVNCAVLWALYSTSLQCQIRAIIIQLQLISPTLGLLLVAIL